nr:MAG TPA: large terminase [Caudoviricetes sp.]
MQARIRRLWAQMTDAEREEVAQLSQFLPRWMPLPGPQALAYTSQADIIGYGGAAGGGKTDLACGKALTQHRQIMILRREATQLTGIIDRLRALVGNSDGYNGAEKIWRMADGRQIEFGSVPNAGDWTKYQGRPHDLLVFDEAANFRELDARALLGWLRSTDPNQKCQALLTFNPPTTVEGRWVMDFFAPWLDRKFPNPAKPGELRYCATIAGRDVWVEDGRAFVLVDGARVYDFDPGDYQAEEIIKPLARTFIPARVTDNPHLVNTGYMATLQALPEPLRSQMLHGDFSAGISDDPWQVIPTAWVEAAMARWRRPDVLPAMDSMGVDVARGGKDETIIARRHGMWFDEPLAYPGKETPNGPATAGLVISALRDRAPIHVDGIGVGAAVYDFLQGAGQQAISVNVAEKATRRDKSGRLTFKNLRSQLWWMMREALDPDANNGIALPPDKRLLADLCAPCWRMQGVEVYVESREDIVKKLGRSPDYASAYCLALLDTPKIHEFMNRNRSKVHDPYRNI